MRTDVNTRTEIHSCSLPTSVRTAPVTILEQPDVLVVLVVDDVLQEASSEAVEPAKTRERSYRGPSKLVSGVFTRGEPRRDVVDSSFFVELRRKSAPRGVGGPA